MAQRPTWPRRPTTDFRPTSLTTRRSCFSRSYVGADPLFLRDAGKPVELLVAGGDPVCVVLERAVTGVLPHRTVSLWREGEHGLDCIREGADVFGLDEVAVAALVDEVRQGHRVSEDQGGAAGHGLQAGDALQLSG